MTLYIQTPSGSVKGCCIKEVTNVQNMTRAFQREEKESIAPDLLIVTDGGCDGKAQEMMGSILPSVRHTEEYKAHIPGPPISPKPHPAFPCQGENSLARDSLRLDPKSFFWLPVCTYMSYTLLHPMHLNLNGVNKKSVNDALLCAIHSTKTMPRFFSMVTNCAGGPHHIRHCCSSSSSSSSSSSPLFNRALRWISAKGVRFVIVMDLFGHFWSF